MTKYILTLMLLMSGVLAINTMGLDLNLREEEEEDRDLEEEDRTIFVITAAKGGFLGLNLSQLIPLLALAAAALLPLLCLCALGSLLIAQLLNQKDSGYMSMGYGNSYSEYGRALGLDSINWEKLSIVDWLSMGEETFRKFEPSNFDCQTRLICEIHQNVNDFGSLAKSAVNLFGYLPYAQVFSLPEYLQSVISEYVDAADKGRSLKKDCGEMFSDCEFSLKALYDKFYANSL